MRVLVPCETATGERRVALTPDAVQRLTASGFEVAVERGAGVQARFEDEAYAGGRARRSRSGADAARGRRACRASVCGGGRWARGGDRADRVSRPARRPGRNRAPAGAGRGGVRDGVDPAHHAGAVHGRPVVAGDGGRLQGGAAGGRSGAEDVSAADDGGGHDRPCAGARAGGGRGRAAGDRDRAAARRGGVGVRRAAGGA